MTGFGKFLVGVAGTSLLAWGAHAMTGAGYIDGLEEQGRAALAAGNFDGATLTMARDPLSRVAVLDGVDDPALRAKIEAAVLATPGIASVRWAGDDGAAGAAAAAGDGDGDGSGGATAEAVTACQSDVDTLMADKVITFRSGSAYMPESSLKVVDEVAAAIKDCDGMTIAVGGHTDATGSDEVNTTISQARADAVAAALTERGIDAGRITAKGFGSSQPKVPGDGANEANRRIEFTLGTGAVTGASEGGE